MNLCSSSSVLFAYSSTPRVSTVHSISRFSCSLKSGGGGGLGGGRWSRSSCLVFCALKLRGAVEVIAENKRSFSSTAAAAATVASGSAYNQDEISTPRTFIDACTEQDLLLGIQKEADAGRLPKNVAEGMEELYYNYRNAVLHSGQPNADEIVLSNMAVAFDRMFMDVRDPFQFSPYHQAIREPFDYYMFGQKYIFPLLDFRNSFLGNISLFNEMEKKLQQGENVILISNHQTEADPAVIALLLESCTPSIAENLIYVAGDRVVIDPLCKPFSMGRNLLCVYSKKHMNDDPGLTDMKKRANTKSLKEMAMLLRGGSKIIWIAPSGGRDRPDPVTKEWQPAPFDASAVDNMRRLVEHAGVPGHIYPLAVLCYDIMPPPLQVEKEIGEKRVMSFHGVGVSVAPEISYQEIAAVLGDPEQTVLLNVLVEMMHIEMESFSVASFLEALPFTKAKMEYSRSLYASVCEQYSVLNSAIHGKRGLEASTPTISLSQPWL